MRENFFQVLWLDNNLLKSLPDDVFYENQETLEQINLESNQLEFVQRIWVQIFCDFLRLSKGPKNSWFSRTPIFYKSNKKELVEFDPWQLLSHSGILEHFSKKKSKMSNIEAKYELTISDFFEFFQNALEYRNGWKVVRRQIWPTLFYCFCKKWASFSSEIH